MSSKVKHRRAGDKCMVGYVGKFLFIFFSAAFISYVLQGVVNPEFHKMAKNTKVKF